MFHHAFFSPRDSPYDQEGEGQRELICREIAGNMANIGSRALRPIGLIDNTNSLDHKQGEHPFADIVHIGDTRCYFETSDNQYRCETDDHTIAGTSAAKATLSITRYPKRTGTTS